MSIGDQNDGSKSAPPEPSEGAPTVIEPAIERRNKSGTFRFADAIEKGLREARHASGIPTPPGMPALPTSPPVEPAPDTPKAPTKE